MWTDDWHRHLHCQSNKVQFKGHNTWSSEVNENGLLLCNMCSESHWKWVLNGMLLPVWPPIDCNVAWDFSALLPCLGQIFPTTVPWQVVRCAVENPYNFLYLLYFFIILNQCYWSSLCLFVGFYKYLTNETHSEELVTKPHNSIGSSNCQRNLVTPPQPPFRLMRRAQSGYRSLLVCNGKINK